MHLTMAKCCIRSHLVTVDEVVDAEAVTKWKSQYAEN
jgi:hypothetical protein